MGNTVGQKVPRQGKGGQARPSPPGRSFNLDGPKFKLFFEESQFVDEGEHLVLEGLEVGLEGGELVRAGFREQSLELAPSAVPTGYLEFRVGLGIFRAGFRGCGKASLEIVENFLPFRG